MSMSPASLRAVRNTAASPSRATLSPLPSTAAHLHLPNTDVFNRSSASTPGSEFMNPIDPLRHGQLDNRYLGSPTIHNRIKALLPEFPSGKLPVTNPALSSFLIQNCPPEVIRDVRHLVPDPQQPVLSESTIHTIINRLPGELKEQAIRIAHLPHSVYVPPRTAKFLLENCPPAIKQQLPPDTNINNLHINTAYIITKNLPPTHREGFERVSHN